MNVKIVSPPHQLQRKANLHLVH